MDRAVISVKNEKAEELIKDAKKKAIDEGVTFSEAMLRLISKWVSGEISINKNEGVQG